MKNYKLKIILLAFTFSLIFPVYANAALIINRPLYIGLDQGLVGYWDFSEKNISGTSTFDLSGNGNAGTLTGGVAKTIGKIGQGLSFDGVDDSLPTADINATDGASQLTVSAWVYQNTLLVSKSIVSKWGGSANWILQIDDTDPDRMLSFAGGSWDKIALSPDSSHKAGEWEHWVMVFDGTQTEDVNRLKMYRNGIQQSLTFGGTIPATTNDNASLVTIGHDPPDGSCGSLCAFNGLLDDVRIYNRALSADEIKRLYNIGGTFKINSPINTGSLAQGLVGYWSFDELDASGTDPLIVYDRSGQNNHGSSTGANVPSKTIGKIGQALEFASSDSQVISTPSQTQPQNYSISFWMKSTETSIMGIISWYPTRIYTYDSCYSGNRLYFDHGDCSFGASFVVGNLLDGGWHHIVAVGDTSGGRALYKDSVFMVAGTASAGADTSEILLGQVEFSSYFNGSLDDVRIYNRTLSADEIKRLYKIGSTFKINVANNSGSLANGLVGYWSFDELDASGTDPLIVYDRSGQNNHGSSTGANIPNKTIGKIGQALEFDGNSDYLSAGNGSSLNYLEKFTYSAWIYPASVSGYRHILDKNYRVLYTSDGGVLTLLISRAIENTTGWCDEVIVTNKWQHVVATWNGGTSSSIKLYIDSTLCTVSMNDGSGTLDNDLSYAQGIGAYSDGSSDWFSGLIDDVRIYNRALSPDEIKRLYNMGR